MNGSTEGGILSLVGTPIGNLADVSPRVLDTLRTADVILCEDTRVTGRLLSHFGIHASLERADENVLASRIAPTLERIAAGHRIAFVSDAGMPGVSDPGIRLVDAALDAGLSVEVIPGPSAVTCALVLSGLSVEHFFFEGFLPRKAGARQTRLAVLSRIPGALVLYESPHRVITTLRAIAGVMPQRRVALARELTKVHEEVMRGTADELVDMLVEREATVGSLKGECVLVVDAPSAEELRQHAIASAIYDTASGLRKSEKTAVASGHEVTLDEAIRAGLARSEPKSALAKKLAKVFFRPRAEIYARVLELADGQEEASS
jgi:16S rRNA (cytidine1402-2'-O)-methyltransferase